MEKRFNRGHKEKTALVESIIIYCGVRSQISSKMLGYDKARRQENNSESVRNNWKATYLERIYKDHWI